MTPDTRGAPEIQCKASQMAASLLQSEFYVLVLHTYIYIYVYVCRNLKRNNLTQKVQLGDNQFFLPCG